MTSSRIALVGEHHLEEGEAASRAPVEHPRDTVAVLPRDLEAQVDAFVEHYNHRRYHESLGNLAPADIYFGRDQAILQERERIKRQTMEHRRLLHRSAAAKHVQPDAPEPLLSQDAICPEIPDDGHVISSRGIPG